MSPASSNFINAKGRNAGGTITKKRFVKMDRTATDGETVVQCDHDGESAYGVSLYSVSSAEILRGKGVSVLTEGRAVVEAAGAIAVDDPVSTSANGRAQVAQTGDIILGRCDEPASTAGHECSVSLSTSSHAVSAGS